MKRTVQKTWKCCALCKNYNNGWGPRSLKVEGVHLVSYESTEKHPCSLNGTIKEAWVCCPKFESRY